MYRLNQAAFDLLQAELQNHKSSDPTMNVQQELVLRRLEKLRAQVGTPLTLAELRDCVLDLLPDFSDRVLKTAVRANQPSKASLSWLPLKRVSWILLGLAGGAGFIWFLNLPYPPIRWPVSKVAPFVLIPSFISMDYNYRQVIALTEQADQLVNQATSAADLELGQTKVKNAQKSLDALPVWFLGYYPQFYCAWFQCGWRFTVDEFEQARKSVARMDARLFQEKNAQTQLNQADQTVGTAKQQYQQSQGQSQKETAIAQWRQGMDALQEVPPTTLAGRMAKTKLSAYERDFQQVSGVTAGTDRSGRLIEVAQEFAKIAKQSGSGNSHTVAEWEEAQQQWNEAIDRLRKIDVKDPDYVPAQKLLASYQQQLGTVRVRLKAEQEAVRIFEQVQQQTQALIANTPVSGKNVDRNQLISQLQRIISQLKKIPAGTTVSAEAQDYLKAAEAKLQQIQS